MKRWRGLATAALLVASSVAAGTGSSAAGPVADLRLLTAVSPQHGQPATFVLSARPVRDLYPSAVRPLNLTVVNPYPFDLRITALRGAVVGTTDSRCRPGNVVVGPYTGDLPLLVGARRRIDAGTLPVHMRPTADQACAGVTFRVQLTGTARRVGR